MVWIKKKVIKVYFYKIIYTVHRLESSYTYISIYILVCTYRTRFKFSRNIISAAFITNYSAVLYVYEATLVSENIFFFSVGSGSSG